MNRYSNFEYDFVIIGSGFGGSVSALRLSEKGYSVLVIEKGKHFTSKDFPKTNWNLRRWLWLPFFRLFGFFRLSFLRHVTILSGVGVGGGSLVYANTLAVPQKEFFEAPSWAGLANWQKELGNYYKEAERMLGAARNPKMELGDIALESLARNRGLLNQFEKTKVGIFFGEPDEEVDDPYFKGLGPARRGCIFCGGCMVGCRFNAKNTLDKNYLYLAQKKGAIIQAEKEVIDVIPIFSSKNEPGYKLRWRSSTSFLKKKGEVTSAGVIFSGGVLGTVKLLLQLKEKSLPRLSDKTGHGIRTNSESLIGVTTFDREKDFSKGIAIGSILHTDQHSHLEPVRYSAGSGFWRFFVSPLVHGDNLIVRLFRIVADIFVNFVSNLKVFFVWDWAKRTQILLFMQTISSTLAFKMGRLGLKSILEKGEKPTAFIPEARELALQYAHLVKGKAMAWTTETILGRPTTAHILGGAVMGKDISEGVIDKNNKVFGYPNMYVCDGSMISANPGVNPSLTITALTERAMNKIPKKSKKK